MSYVYLNLPLLSINPQDSLTVQFINDASECPLAGYPMTGI